MPTFDNIMTISQAVQLVEHFMQVSTKEKLAEIKISSGIAIYDQYVCCLWSTTKKHIVNWNKLSNKVVNWMHIKSSKGKEQEDSEGSHII